MYEIVQVTGEPDQLEQLGSKTKFWFMTDEGCPFLFKEGRPNSGENWAEKIASELCGLLDLPHAEYELAEWNRTKGVVTRTFIPRGGRLLLGNELLARFVKGYATDRIYKQTQHTVSAVMAILRHRGIELGVDYQSDAVVVAADVFTGYLMLDAWIGNTDRHHENWGLLVIPPRRVVLAPTFDHASSLGREESDERRQERLLTRDKRRSAQAYADRAKSAFFRFTTDIKPLSTLDAFLTAARLRRRAGLFWLDRLLGIETNSVTTIFQNVPPRGMSDLSKCFALRILDINRDRLYAQRAHYEFRAVSNLAGSRNSQLVPGRQIDGGEWRLCLRLYERSRSVCSFHSFWEYESVRRKIHLKSPISAIREPTFN
jgi:hypothetical protein